MKQANRAWTVPADHPALDGHFPDRPILPGVVWLEQVRRLAGEELGLTPGPSRWPRVKFLRPVAPGQTVTLELQERPGGFDFRILDPAGLIGQGQCRLPE